MASIRSGIGEFQSTLPREERLFHNCFEHVFNYFNPRSHERSDHSPYSHRYSIYNFNPRSHERSDHKAFKLIVSFYQFQSTLPREERRELLHLDFQQRNFNPRSHERSDGILLKSTLLITYFNPRSHERSDKND